MFKKIGLWRGLTGLFVALMVLIIFASIILTDHSSTINRELGIETSRSVEEGSGSGEEIDTEYYKPSEEFGEINAENLVKLENAAMLQTETEAAEGAVLLKNENDALPLKSGEKVSLFGHAAYDPLYLTSAATTKVVSKKAGEGNPELIVDLHTALKEAGVELNSALYNSYDKKSNAIYDITSKIRQGFSHNVELPLSFYEAQSASYANASNEVAIVSLKREAGEGADMSTNQAVLLGGEKNTRFVEGTDVANSLALQTNERAMMNLVKNAGFKKIIVLVNTNYQMELGWLDEFNVDACLFIGTPGLTGFRGIASILKGDVNPSGKLVSTFASNSLSSPAIKNAATNTAKWSNWNSFRNDGIVVDGENGTDYVSVQQEGIYVDYKYYETRYADCVMDAGSANSNVGSTDGDEWNYAKEMCYPFGFGLSYTDFDQIIENVDKNEITNTYTVTVKVENTGNEPGKCAVQLYVSTPYGEYEKGRGIEKPAILFVGFEKTGVIPAGESETVIIEVDEYLFASYDMNDGGGYMLSAGDYYFAVGNGAHEALNNVLAAKETGFFTRFVLEDHNGDSFTAGSNKTYYWNMANHDYETHSLGEDGKKVVNRFEKMDINYWNRKNGAAVVDYLSRAYWDITFPTASAQVSLLGAEMQTLLQGDYYKKGGNEYLVTESFSTDEYAQGKSNSWNGIDNNTPFIKMVDVKYDEDDKWEAFLDQFSLADLAAMTGNDFGNAAIGGYVNLKARPGGDGCQGVGAKAYDTALTPDYDAEHGLSRPESTKNQRHPCLYTSLMTCTMNKELIENRGRLMANQALFLNQTVIWSGGGNLHRTPFGGRQAEYYSADANLSYLVGMIEMPAMEKLGILGGIKHFAGNDQESYREGVNTFYTEQSFRENALRGFEGALRKGKVKAVMSAFSRQGVKYTSSCPEINITVLREEWGFVGHVITDASSGAVIGYKSHYTTSISTGTDTYCLDGSAVGGNAIAKSIRDNDDGYLLGQLRRAAKNTCYALLNSAAINGHTENTRVITFLPAWQITVYVVMGLCIAFAAASLVMFGLSKFMAIRKKEAHNE